MAEALMAGGRAWAKPLRCGGEELLPDFVFVDDIHHADVGVWVSAAEKARRETMQQK